MNKKDEHILVAIFEKLIDATTPDEDSGNEAIKLAEGYLPGDIPDLVYDLVHIIQEELN